MNPNIELTYELIKFKLIKSKKKLLNWLKNLK